MATEDFLLKRKRAEESIKGLAVFDPETEYEYYKNESVTYPIEEHICIVPDGVIQIDPYAFYAQHSLEKIILPASCTKIGEGAFYGCKNLKEVVHSENVRIIKRAAFENCYSLEDFSFSKEFQNVEDYTFMNCIGLCAISLPSDLKTIGNCAFASCGVESISIPSAVVYLGENAFAYNSKLKEVSLADILNVRIKQTQVFNGCDNLHSFYYI